MSTILASFCRKELARLDNRIAEIREEQAINCRRLASSLQDLAIDFDTEGTRPQINFLPNLHDIIDLTAALRAYELERSYLKEAIDKSEKAGEI